MTKLLDQAIAKVRKLPSDRQDEAAEFLLSFLDNPPDAVRLSPEQQREVARRLADPERTHATEKEVEAQYRKLGA